MVAWLLGVIVVLGTDHSLCNRRLFVFFLISNRALKQFVLVTPPQEPKALTRLWCTWELYNAISHECTVHIHTSGKLYGDFQNMLMKKKQFKTIISNMASKIACVHAQASLATHADLLNACVKEVGVEKIDRLLSNCTKNWLATKGDEMINRLLRSSSSKDDSKKDRKIALDGCSIVATLYKELGNLEKAEPSYRRVFELREELLGKDHLRTIKAMQNLGSLLQQLNLNGAAKKSWKSLAGTFNRRNNPNGTLDNSYLAEAELLFRRALVKQEQILGLTDPQTLQSLNNFAVFCQKNQKLREAELLYRRAYKGFQQAHGKMHGHTLQAGHNLASLLQEQGETMQAEAMYRSVYEGRVAVLGGEDPITLQTLSRLGTVLQQLGNIREAEGMFQQLVTLHTEGQGTEATETFHAMSMLASCMIDAQKTNEAEPLLREVHEGRTKCFGANDMESLQATSDLANFCYTKGNMQESEQLHTIVLKGRKELLGKRHLDTLKTVTKLAAVSFAQNKLEDAEDLYMQAYQGYKRKLGGSDSCTMLCVDMLARLLLKQNKFDKALPFYEAASQHYSSTLGPTHPDTLNMKGTCGICMQSLGRAVEGQELVQQCLVDLNKVKDTLAIDSPMIKPIDKRINRFEKAIVDGKNKVIKEQQKRESEGGASGGNEFDSVASKRGGGGDEQSRSTSKKWNVVKSHFKPVGFGVMFANRMKKFTTPTPPLTGSPRTRTPPSQKVGRRGPPRGALRGGARGVPRGVSQQLARAAMPVAMRGNPRGRPRPPPTMGVTSKSPRTRGQTMEV